MKGKIGLTELIHQKDLGIFINESWNQNIFLFKNNLGKKRMQILCLDSFEQIIGSLYRANEGWLHFAKGGVKQIPNTMLDKDGMLKIDKIKSAFLDGETLYLTKAEHLSSSIMHLCRGVENDLKKEGIYLRKAVNAHVFLTPPNSTGFPTHRDEHSSFVLQLEGSKIWNVYESKKSENNQTIFTTGKVENNVLSKLIKRTFVLSAGDVLYVPAWLPHKALTSSEHSLHITIRVFPLRYADILKDLIPHHPTLSSEVPTKLISNKNKLMNHIGDLLNSSKFIESSSLLIEEIFRDYEVPEKVLPGDSIRQSLSMGNIKSDTYLERPDGLECIVFNSGDESFIKFPGGKVKASSQVRTVLEFICNSNQFRPCDLPLINGREYDRLEFVRNLIRSGVLRVVQISSLPSKIKGSTEECG